MTTLMPYPGQLAHPLRLLDIIAAVNCLRAAATVEPLPWPFGSHIAGYKYKTTAVYNQAAFRYSFAELEPTVLAELESINLHMIQQLANRSRRWTVCYITGLNKQKGFVER